MLKSTPAFSVAIYLINTFSLILSMGHGDIYLPNVLLFGCHARGNAIMGMLCDLNAHGHHMMTGIVNNILKHGYFSPVALVN